MNTNRLTYSDMVKALQKPGDAILASLTPLDCQKLHMASALVGEMGEVIETVTMNDLVEEMGDVEFFFEGVRQLYFNSEVHAIEYKAPYRQLVEVDLVKAACTVFDFVKKEVIYRKVINMEDMYVSMCRMRAVMDQLYKQSSLTREAVQEANRVKLMEKRYKSGKYSDKAAQDREDKK